MKYLLPPVFALIVCLAIFWKWTAGFQAFTVFTYTLHEAGTLPRTFPELKMINQDSLTFTIKDKQKYVLLNFVYLNCPYVCHKVNNRLEEIYNAVDSNIIASKLELVTVSFDVKNDNIQKIKNYRSHFGVNIHGWSFALPFQAQQFTFEKYLQKVGVWARAAPGSSIVNHSIYLFLISPENKLIKVFDPARENNAAIIAKLNSCLKDYSS